MLVKYFVVCSRPALCLGRSIRAVWTEAQRSLTKLLNVRGQKVPELKMNLGHSDFKLFECFLHTMLLSLLFHYLKYIMFLQNNTARKVRPHERGKKKALR